MKRLILTFLAALMLISTPSWSKDSITLRINPHVSLAPATVEVYVHVGSHPAGSDVVLIIDGGSYYAQSRHPLPDDPDEPSQLPVKTYRGLPAGDYSFIAAITEGDGKEQKFLDGVVDQIRVVEPGDPTDQFNNTLQALKH